MPAKKYKTDEERKEARREYERTPARREYKRQWALKNRQKKKEDLLNDNRQYTNRGHNNNNKGYTNDTNIYDNDVYNIDNNVSDSINLQDNDVNNDIFQFDEIDNNNTHIIDDNNFDNEVITVEINDEQLKNILSIVVVLYVYFRIFDFSLSNVVVQKLETKDKYIKIIDRLTTKLKTTIEKYDYLKRIYSNIDDFMFIVDVILLASVIEDEINNTVKENNLKESKQQNITKEYTEPTNLFDRL